MVTLSIWYNIFALQKQAVKPLKNSSTLKRCALDTSSGREAYLQINMFAFGPSTASRSTQYAYAPSIYGAFTDTFQSKHRQTEQDEEEPAGF